MSRLRGRIGKATRTLALAVALLALPATLARAQFMGYGGMGYGYGGMGYGGMGYGGMGYGGMGYGGMGYGYPGFAYGGYGGYPAMGFGVGIGYPWYGVNYSQGYALPYGGLLASQPGLYNPLFGLGLTPLGVQSGLTESAIIRGAGIYGPRYGTTYYGAGYR